MKTLTIAATAVALLSAIAFTSTADAAFYKHRHGGLTASERAAVARSQARLNVLKWRVRADGHVSFWERMKIKAAQSRHNALVYRYRHN